LQFTLQHLNCFHWRKVSDSLHRKQ
jgi:hypothetical protein